MSEVNLARFDPLEGQLQVLIESPELSKQLYPSSWDYLPSILDSLKHLQSRLLQQPIDNEKCLSSAGAFGRLVMEYPDLPDSALGKELLWLATDVIRMAKGSGSERTPEKLN